MPASVGYRSGEDGPGRIGHDRWLASSLDGGRAAQLVLYCSGIDDGFRPQGIYRYLAGVFVGHPQYTQAHAVLGHGVGHVAAKPVGCHVQWRGQVEDVRVGGFLQMGQAQLAGHEGAATVDLMHQVVGLHGGGFGAGQGDGTGIVDQNVDAAKGVYGLVHGGLQLFLVANIPHAGQGCATRLADFLGRGIDGAR